MKMIERKDVDRIVEWYNEYFTEMYPDQTDLEILKKLKEIAFDNSDLDEQIEFTEDAIDRRTNPERKKARNDWIKEINEET